MKRLFVAIKIHPSPALLQLYYNLKKELVWEKIKWVEDYNFHLTLKFLGNTYASQMDKIIEVLDGIAMETLHFEMSIQDPGIFGSRYNPRVIWLGIESTPQLIDLSNKVLDGFDKVGFLRDRQNFVPHLTIGRIKYINNKKHLKNIIDKNKGKLLQNIIVNEFYLYESILTRKGPIYKVIQEFSLK